MFYGEPKGQHKNAGIVYWQVEIGVMREAMKEGFKCEESGELEVSCHSTHRKRGKCNGRKRNRSKKNWRVCEDLR